MERSWGEVEEGGEGSGGDTIIQLLMERRIWSGIIKTNGGVCVCVLCVFEYILVQCACYRESYVAPSVAKEWCSNMMLNRVQAKAKAQRKVERKSVTLC